MEQRTTNPRMTGNKLLLIALIDNGVRNTLVVVSPRDCSAPKSDIYASNINEVGFIAPRYQVLPEAQPIEMGSIVKD